MEKRKTTIAICASAAFYEYVFEVEAELKKMGFAVKIPYTAEQMRKNGNFQAEIYKVWLKKQSAPEQKKAWARKAWLMRNHMRKVVLSDATLVVNLEKNGIAGYIGGNVLIEMSSAFLLKKPIFILNPLAEGRLGYEEEILGMQPVFLNGSLAGIKEKLGGRRWQRRK